MTLGQAIVAAFEPVLAPLGYRLVSSGGDRASFASEDITLTAKLEPRDGELGVYLQPHDGGDRIQLLMYLRSIGFADAPRLAEVADTEADALPHVPIFARGLSAATS